MCLSAISRKASTSSTGLLLSLTGDDDIGPWPLHVRPLGGLGRRTVLGAALQRQLHPDEHDRHHQLVAHLERVPASACEGQERTSLSLTGMLAHMHTATRAYTHTHARILAQDT